MLCAAWPEQAAARPLAPLPAHQLSSPAAVAEAPADGRSCEGRQDPALAAAVNAARQQRGLPSLLPLPADAAERNCRYLSPLLRRMLAGGLCDHDRERWQALVQDHGADQPFSPMSELILCPSPRPVGADEVVRLWLQSPLHRDLLLHRPRATAIECVEMTVAGRTAAICTTWRGNGRTQV